MTKRPITETIPVAPLKIIALDNCKEFGEKVNDLIVEARKKMIAPGKNSPAFIGYEADSYLLDVSLNRYATGEGQASINDSVRGTDLFILCDVTNSSIKYRIDGEETKASPDDHFSNLKRMIGACNGKTNRIHVIMPYLYEGRQDMRTHLETLDCSLALNELASMGVSTIITFDAHEPRVQNALPIQGFDIFHTSYQFIKTLVEHDPDIPITKSELMIISPDVGGMKRAVYYANQLGLDMGMFYRRLDYTKTVNNEHPVAAIEFLGNDISGKNAFIIDDMIATGYTILDTAKELKKRNAKKVIIAATFGLFNDGLEMFDRAYEEGVFDKIYTTNLCYCSPELISRPYYVNVDLSKYVALIIDTVNNDTSINEIQNPTAKIQEFLESQRRS